MSQVHSPGESDGSVPTEGPHEAGVSLVSLAVPLVENLRMLVLLPLLAGLIALAITYLLKPTFTARSTFLPPQQQQSSAASALASLSALSGLVGASTSMRSSVDQYVSLMQSVTVMDRLIDEFKLMAVYDVEKRHEARRELISNTRIVAGKKDGIISVEVDDHDPERAAAIANRYVEELRLVTAGLALTEAQQRRSFFEAQLKATRDSLTSAQRAVQQSGFNAGDIKAEPKAAAEAYARLRAEETAAEVRLQTIRRNFADGSTEVQRQSAQLSALRGQLAEAERNTQSANGPDYLSKYREFKYQETLFELLARQYEMARLDESREGALIQVIDAATAPDHKSKPQRAVVVALTVTISAVLLVLFLALRHLWRQTTRRPDVANDLVRLRKAWRPR